MSTKLQACTQLCKQVSPNKMKLEFKMFLHDSRLLNLDIIKHSSLDINKPLSFDIGRLPGRDIKSRTSYSLLLDKSILLALHQLSHQLFQQLIIIMSTCYSVYKAHLL